MCVKFMEINFIQMIILKILNVIDIFTFTDENLKTLNFILGYYSIFLFYTCIIHLRDRLLPWP